MYVNYKMAKERNLVKKKCPYCERMISKSGWNMHIVACSDKHDEPIVKWDEVEGGAQVSDGEQSFRGEGGGEGSREKEFWEETFGE